MEVNQPDLTVEKWSDILRECYESIPQEARDKAEAEAKADAEREADPEFQRERAEFQAAMFAAMREIDSICEREGHNNEGGHCKRCGRYGSSLSNDPILFDP